MSDQKNNKILEVKNLKVSYHTYAGEVKSVRGVSFDSNKELSVSKEKIDILIREIKAKGEKVIKVYNSFSQVDSCGYSLTQLYKLTEQNINYKDNEYRFFTTMTKCSMFQ